jgi:hypothetical protein
MKSAWFHTSRRDAEWVYSYIGLVDARPIPWLENYSFRRDRIFVGFKLNYGGGKIQLRGWTIVPWGGQRFR